MDTNTVVFLSVIVITNIINFAYNIYTGRIQKTRIEGLEATLKQQTESVNIIKAFAELKDVEDYKNYTDLKMENVRMEREKEINELNNKISQLSDKLKDYENGLDEKYDEIYSKVYAKLYSNLKENKGESFF